MPIILRKQWCQCVHGFSLFERLKCERKKSFITFSWQKRETRGYAPFHFLLKFFQSGYSSFGFCKCIPCCTVLPGRKDWNIFFDVIIYVVCRYTPGRIFSYRWPKSLIHKKGMAIKNFLHSVVLFSSFERRTKNSPFYYRSNIF